MNGTSKELGGDNVTGSQFDTNEYGTFGRHEFLQLNPWIAIPSIIVLAVASLGGTFGNVLTLLAVAFSGKIRHVEKTFIVNLALSDLYVTAIADPMSIVAKLEGEHFFDRIPKLCQTIASLCTISCVTSLMTIAMMSVYRYIFVCHNQHYSKIFSKKKCMGICMALYCIGIMLVLLNQAGIGDHSFDRKSIECIWDRMATYPYTVVFSVTLVWIPCLMIGICYLMLYLYVRNQRKIMASHQQNKPSTSTSQPPALRETMQLDMAKTLFLIYAVFVTCWAPYALFMVIDVNDTFSHEAHVLITTFAHLHPSVNWLIYLSTQRRFEEAYRYVLTRCWRDARGEESQPINVVEKFLTKCRVVEMSIRRNRFRRNAVHPGEIPSTNNARGGGRDYGVARNIPGTDKADAYPDVIY